jgi:hypothetical protein
MVSRPEGGAPGGGGLRGKGDRRRQADVEREGVDRDGVRIVAPNPGDRAPFPRPEEERNDAMAVDQPTDA